MILQPPPLCHSGPLIESSIPRHDKSTLSSITWYTGPVMNEGPPFLPGLPKTAHQLSKDQSKWDDIKLRAIARSHKTDKKSPPPRSLYRLQSAPNTYDSLPTTAHRNLERAPNRREMNQDLQANLAKPVPYIETISRYVPLRPATKI